MSTATLPSDLSDPVRDFVSSPHNHLIGGESAPAADDRTFDTLDPATGNALAEVAYGGAEDVDRAVGAARSAFEQGAWASASAAERGRCLERLAALVEEHADELAELESLDNGKPVKMAKLVDVGEAVAHLRYFAGWPTKLEGEVIPVASPNTLCYTRVEPVGVCGQIVPWNFPLLMACWKIAAALAAGCTLVLKPAEQTPLTALRLGELDLEAAIKGSFMAIYFNTGQSCNAGSHLFVQKDQFDDVVSAIAQQAQKMKLGPGLDQQTQMGPLVSAEQRERVTGYIESGKSEGAELVTGGGMPDGNGQGYFVEPTLFAATSDDLRISREEIFGPVLVALPYESLEEVAARANDTDYGLAAGVWTRSLSNAHRLAALLKAGSVYINRWGQSDPGAPFGGYKASGIGREHGRTGLDAYRETIRSRRPHTSSTGQVTRSRWKGYASSGRSRRAARSCLVRMARLRWWEVKPSMTRLSTSSGRAKARRA